MYILLQSEDIEVKRDCVLRGLCAYLNEESNTLIKEYLVSIAFTVSFQSCNVLSVYFKMLKLFFTIRTSTLRKLRETSHRPPWGFMWSKRRVLMMRKSQRMLAWWLRAWNFYASWEVFPVDVPCFLGSFTRSTWAIPKNLNSHLSSSRKCWWIWMVTDCPQRSKHLK